MTTGYDTSPIAATFTPAERERLILDGLPQVRWIASRIKDSLPASISLDDLISTGILGLIAAVDHFDPSRNLKLSTYAEHKIRGAILDSVRGLDGVPLRKRKLIAQIEQAIAQAEQSVGRAPDDEEIASQLGIPLAEYQQWLLDTQGVTLGSLDAVSDESGASLLNFIPNREATQDTVFEQAELERLLAGAIERMPILEAQVLSMYYKDELTLREIAEVMQTQIPRVWQVRTQGILRLRAFLQRQWPGSRGVQDPTMSRRTR